MIARTNALCRKLVHPRRVEVIAPGGLEAEHHHVGPFGVASHGLADTLGALDHALTAIVQIGAGAVVAVDADVEALCLGERRMIAGAERRQISAGRVQGHGSVAAAGKFGCEIASGLTETNDGDIE